MNPTSSGVYFITNNISGKKYIGSAINLQQRETDHWKNLRAQKHRNKHLQNAWNKYGEESFSFSVLEFVKNKKDLIATEQRYFDIFKPEYNKCPTAGNMLGFKHSSESKQKQRLAKLKSWKDPEYRQGMVDAHTGYNPSPETRKKISDVSRGEMNGFSKLTEDKVIEIKRLLSEGGMFQGQIAKLFGVKRKCINAINTGTNWRHINIEEVD